MLFTYCMSTSRAFLILPYVSGAHKAKTYWIHDGATKFIFKVKLNIIQSFWNSNCQLTCDLKVCVGYFSWRSYVAVLISPQGKKMHCFSTLAFEVLVIKVTVKPLRFYTISKTVELKQMWWCPKTALIVSQCKPLCRDMVLDSGTQLRLIFIYIKNHYLLWHMKLCKRLRPELNIQTSASLWFTFSPWFFDPKKVAGNLIHTLFASRTRSTLHKTIEAILTL